MTATSPIRPTDHEARELARGLLDTARYGAIGVSDPDDGTPMVTRVAIGTDLEGSPVTLISDLSHHTRALNLSPACSLLLGEPGSKGDPLTHPRITLQCDARFVQRDGGDHATIRERFLLTHPKAKLYIDFADFRFVRFSVRRAYLNGGFGKAFHLSAADLSA
jgi:putative heme iron utilization protein